MKPVTTPDTAYRKKKLEPTRPNWLGVNPKSFMIGTAARPITALSAKLISINTNRRRTITQAYFDGLCVCTCFLPAHDCQLRRSSAGIAAARKTPGKALFQARKYGLSPHTVTRWA